MMDELCSQLTLFCTDGAWNIWSFYIATIAIGSSILFTIKRTLEDDIDIFTGTLAGIIAMIIMIIIAFMFMGVVQIMYSYPGARIVLGLIFLMFVAAIVGKLIARAIKFLYS